MFPPMKALLTSTSYFPPLRYMAECMHAQRITVEAYETYAKQTFRNRCEIAGPNGRQKLVVPVIKTDGNHTQTRDIRIAYDLPWQKIHLRSVTAAYNRSPFLIHYIDHFHPFFEKRYEFLLDMNTGILVKLLEILGSGKTIGLTSYYEKKPEGVYDKREELSPKRPFVRQPAVPYTQPFTERYGFLEDLSVLDVIFCLGPEARGYLQVL